MTKKVLITDDSVFVRTMLKKILVANGYEIVGEAKNGAEAINLYKELSPDIVTMDITMPDMDGVQVVKKIIEMDPTAIIVMCSAENNRAEIFNAIKAGAKEFIMKPFEEQQVIDIFLRLKLEVR
ncbi:MAG: response regulator [Sporomusaceae bacterium]|nr:response regulator [Sporomusaceae bacterium]